MKKLSLLVALALLITVGGVYATWDYANKQIAVNPVTMPGSIQMATVTNALAKGTLVVNHDHFTVWVDDRTNNYIPDLSYGTKEVDGVVVDKTEDDVYIALTFTPAEKGADQSVYEDAIALNYWFTVSEGMEQYNGRDIFTVNATAANKASVPAGTATSEDTPYWVKGADGSFTAKLPVSMILGISHDGNGDPISYAVEPAVVLNNDFKLSEMGMYNAFNEALDSGYLILHVEENVALNPTT